MQRAAIDYITALARTTSVNTQLVGNLNVRGSLFTLPGGDVQAVLGYEHRREHASFDPGAYYYGQTLPNGTRAGYGNAVPVNFASGTFDTNEGFAELHAPIVSADMGWRFVNRLELEAAARYVHNSLSGGGWTYTLGGSLAPVEGLTFRGNFTHSIRSPSLAEAYSPRSSATDSGADPCDVRYIASGPNPGRRAANCAAGGVPANLVSNFASASVPVTVEGNPNLRNEQANSYTFGAVVAPRFAPGLTVSADYVNITLKDAIRRLTGSQILNACYDAASFPSSYCGLITRNAAGQITGIEEGYYNLASAKVKALSAELRYAFDLARLGLKGEPGGIEFDFNFYHLIDQYSRVGTGDVDHTVGEVGNPRNSFTATLGYRRKAFDVQWQTQYYGPSRFDADAAPGTYEYPGVKHWYLFNASVGTTVARAFDLRLIVNNVLDSAPPFPAPAGSGTITYFSGLVGRAFELSFGAKF
jgi:outer membrane receptor protein involved in Fe transport